MQISNTWWTDHFGLKYEGEYVPYRAATRTDPEEGGCIEDLGIVGISVEIVSGRMPSGSPILSVVDALAGCDLKSPDIQRLFANLTEAFQEQLQEAGIEDATE